MSTADLYNWIANNLFTGTARNPETGKAYKSKEVKELSKNEVIIRVGGKERPLNQCKLENGRLILIG